MKHGITWYEVMGVLPGAAADRIRRRYGERAALLRGEMIAGAPSNVLVSVRRAQEFLDGAWEVLGDPATRRRYDEATGFRRRGGGLPPMGGDAAGGAGSARGAARLACGAVDGVAKHAIEHYLDFVSAGFDLTPVITHRFPLARWDEAVLALKDPGRTGAVKVLLEPGG